ncbi:hypothetical protein J6590_004052 [Homalodisca vitripennis]|nr:hypothetical protein J6590_004052 [Homalodisca vitripennis]
MRIALWQHRLTNWPEQDWRFADHTCKLIRVDSMATQTGPTFHGNTDWPTGLSHGGFLHYICKLRIVSWQHRLAHRAEPWWFSALHMQAENSFMATQTGPQGSAMVVFCTRYASSE